MRSSNLLQSGLINAIVDSPCLPSSVSASPWWRGTGELGLATLSVLLPLSVRAPSPYRQLSARAYATARERIAVVNANMQESLSGVRESQAFVRERRNQRDFREVTGSYLNARLRAQRLVSTYFPFVEFLADIARGAGALAKGSVLIAQRSLTAGEWSRRVPAVSGPVLQPHPNSCRKGRSTPINRPGPLWPISTP